MAEEDACLRHIEDLLDLIDATAPADGWERDAALAGAGPLCAKKVQRIGQQAATGAATPPPSRRPAMRPRWPAP